MLEQCSVRYRITGLHGNTVVLPRMRFRLDGVLKREMSSVPEHVVNKLANVFTNRYSSWSLVDSQFTASIVAKRDSSATVNSEDENGDEQFNASIVAKLQNWIVSW